MMNKISPAQAKVLRLAEANWPRSVTVRASDRTIFILERQSMIAASSIGKWYSVMILCKGREWVQANSKGGSPKASASRPNRGHPHEWLDERGKVERGIVGAIKDAINAHGPITAENVSSAAKRVYAQLKSARREYRKAKGK